MFQRFWNGLRNLRRDYRNPANIYASLRVVFLFAHFFGLTPYHIIISSKTRRHILCTSTYGYFAMASRFIFLHVNIMYSILHNHTVIEYFFTSDISHFTDSMQKYNGVAGNVIAMGFCFVQRKRLCTLVRRMHRIEERFFNVGVSFMQKYVATHTNRFALAIFALTIFYFQLSMFGILARNNVYISLPAAVSYYAPHLLVCGIVQLYYAMIYKLTQYFRALNKVLKKLAHQWDNSIVKPMPKQRSLQCLDSFSMYTIVTNNPCEIIQESMEIHHMICDAASTANKYFTYQLLTIISIAFLLIVFDAYYVLEILLGKSAHEGKFKTAEFVTFFSCQMILYVIAIVSIVEGSNRAIQKSEKTSGIVHSLLNKAKNAELKEKLQQFSLQLLHLKIHFTAAGLFNIDRTLYFTISGALTTYLIILLQFSNSNVPEHPFPPMEENDTTPIRSLVSNLTIGG
ncbi:putative gustatory receptor 28b isoform X2 [Bactrocera dorsalis]|uniref:Gustatory receptor n=1 Tax=Bactrocera dorsalis TaxID=27457 RepID=A0ABM3JDI3_BACDO|nr:putative gustatory receptor 28b isoform X2 [Bactrocera dorsalis]